MTTNRASCFCTLTTILIAFFAATTVIAQEKIATVTSESRWHRNAVDNAHMNRRIADAAEQYKEYAPIPRIAFYDIGFPKDQAEFEELNGYGILLVSALSQDASELPIKKVYAVVDGREFVLETIREISLKNNNLTSQVVRTFGEYRTDTLFLFPVHLRFESGEILVDFAKNRIGMKLAGFDGSIPETIKHLPRLMPDEKRTVTDAIQRFIKREYPGYADNR